MLAGTELDAVAGVAAWGCVLSLENEAFLVGAFRRSAADVLPLGGLGAVACCCTLGSVSGGVSAAFTDMLAPAEAALSSISCTLWRELDQAHQIRAQGIGLQMSHVMPLHLVTSDAVRSISPATPLFLHEQ